MEGAYEKIQNRCRKNRTSFSLQVLHDRPPNVPGFRHPPVKVYKEKGSRWFGCRITLHFPARSKNRKLKCRTTSSCSSRQFYFSCSFSTPSSLFEGSTTNISHLSADERQRRRKGSLLSGDTVDDLTAAKERPTRCRGKDRPSCAKTVGSSLSLGKLDDRL